MLRANRFTITVNGQVLNIAITENGDTFQTTDYYVRGSNGSKVAGIIGYGGYVSGRVHAASTRTIANMVERHIKAQGWFA